VIDVRVLKYIRSAESHTKQTPLKIKIPNTWILFHNCSIISTKLEHNTIVFWNKIPEVVNDLDKAQMSTESAQETLPPCDATGSDSPKPEFPYFKKFPIEVRLKIWGYLEPEPVIIKPLAPFIGRHRYIRPVPVLLQICRETRTEYITRADGPKDHITYTLCNDLGAWPRYKKIWVSLEEDSVVIDPFLALQSGSYLPLTFRSKKLMESSFGS
jgi:hypothetical protein